jgi:hypothetical protein
VRVSCAGNSVFTECLFKAGYTNITNIDVSAVVITQMQTRHAALEGVECESYRAYHVITT